MLVHKPDTTTFFLPVFLTAFQTGSSSKASKLRILREIASWPGNKVAISGMNSPLDFGLIVDKTTGIPNILAALAAPTAACFMVDLSPEVGLIIFEYQTTVFVSQKFQHTF